MKRFLSLILPLSLGLTFTATATAQVADPLVQVLATHTSSWQTSNKHLVRRCVKSAAPRENLPAPVPNPNNLVSTDKVGYCVWKNLDDNSGNDMVFARTIDRGKTWKVQTIHHSEALEAINHFEIVAVGHTVWVGFHANPVGGTTRPTTNPKPGEFNMFYLVSVDQGQSWNTGTSESKPVIPTPISPGLINVNTAKTADATGTKLYGNAERISMAGAMISGLPHCYFAYEFGNALEEPIFTAFRALGTSISVVVPETLLTKPGSTPNPATAVADTDNAFIAADGLNVFVAWRDNRGIPPSGKNNTCFANFSLDGGKTWNATSIKPGTNTSSSWTHSKHDGMLSVAVDGPNFYVAWGDRYKSHIDNQQELVLAWSNDSCKTWGEKALTSYVVGKGNIRAHGIVADNGRVVAFAETDEEARILQGPNFPGTTIQDIGLVNGLEVFVSNDAGKTFTNTFVNSPMTNKTPAGQYIITDVDYPMIAMRGDIIHIAFAEGWHQQTVWDTVNLIWYASEEDLSLVTSTDGGKTFSQPMQITKIGSRTTGKSTTRPTVSFPPDVDCPRVAIMGNGEALIGFRSNHIPVTPPTLYNRPFAAVVSPLFNADVNDISAATGGTQKLILNAGAKHKGRGYFVAGSLSGYSPGFNLGAAHVSLNPDFFTDLTIALKNTAAFFNTMNVLDGDGRGGAMINIPPGVSAAVGVTMHYAYLVHDAMGFHLGSNAARLTIVP